MLIEIGPGYHDLPQFTLTDDLFSLEPSQRYSFRVDLQKLKDAFGATLISGSAVEYELLADGSLRELRVYHAFTVTLEEEG